MPTAKKKTRKDTAAPRPYAFSVHLDRESEQLIKAEQARRIVNGEKKTTIPMLATEFITKCLRELSS